MVKRFAQDLMHVHRMRREWLRTSSNKERYRRIRRTNLFLAGMTVIGGYAALSADDAVELVLGIGILVGPALVMGAHVWLYWKALRKFRRT